MTARAFAGFGVRLALSAMLLAGTVATVTNGVAPAAAGARGDAKAAKQAAAQGAKAQKALAKKQYDKAIGFAEAAVALDLAGREVEAEQLLGAFVRVRSPQDAARVAGAGPARLVPQLLAAARTVSAAREWDLVHALRVAGIAGA